MATIKTAIALYDGVTGPLQKMHRAMNIVLNSFEEMQRASGKAVDTAAIHAARAELAQAGLAFQSLEQEVQQSYQAQQRFNRSIEKGERAAQGLLSTVKRIGVAVGGLAAVRKVITISDDLTSTNARLYNASINFDDGGSIEALQAKVMASAQRSRSAYLDTAAAVAKIGINAGAAFDSMDELIRFSELINKQYINGGANAQEQSNSMIQLTQALAAGVLRGEELNSVMEGAPGIARAIESYMGIAEGTIRSVAQEGKITADIVKNAMFAAADEINARFEAMPLTWEQVFTMASNMALRATQPLLSGINWVANNISLLAPAIWGVTSALIVYNATQGVAWLTTMKSVAAKTAHAVASAAETAAIFAMMVAQDGLNAALLACPITWILMGIIGVITVLYGAVAAVNRFKGTSISATGLICGAFAVAGAAIANILIALNNIVVNIFVGIWNKIAEVANFLASAFQDPAATVKRIFYSMVGFCLSVLELLTKAIDAVFGSNLTSTVSDWRGSVRDKYNATANNRVNVMRRLDVTDYTRERIRFTDAWDAGKRLGRNIDNRVKGWFNPNGDARGAGKSLNRSADYSSMLDSIYNTAADTAANTAATADALDISQEDLKYLRDIAEREAINRFTTAEIKIEQHNENHINSDMDVDGIMDKWTQQFSQAMDISGEGVHA